jgi:large subunit ribosomal protein L25
MSDAELHVELREKKGRQDAKSLRREGRIPAIYYSHDQETTSLSVDAYTFQRLLQKETHIYDVIFPDGKTRKSIIRELQRDPVTDELIHADFLGIKLDEKIKMVIPIILTGTPTGVKLQGGILEHPIREVEVEGLPLDIPEHIEVEVSAMEIGQIITLENIQADKYRFVTDIRQPIAIVVQPKAVKTETPEEEVLPEEGEEETPETSPETE